LPFIPSEAIFMAVVNRITEQEYRELALHEEDRLWELWDGVPREKPAMSMMHEDVLPYLVTMLINQLDRRLYRVNVNGGKARRSERNYFIPDVMVIPASSVLPTRSDPRSLSAFAEPLPLIVEIWSRSTGHYDYAVKLQAYRERGDEEIWYIHPYERTLTAWRKQLDGSYTEAFYRGGIVPVASLPGVTVDLDALLDD
jgi:Uma2 family endonuclease